MAESIIDRILGIFRSDPSSLPVDVGAEAHSEHTAAGGQTAIRRRKDLVGDPFEFMTQVSADTTLGEGKDAIKIAGVAQSFQYVSRGGGNLFESSVAQMEGGPTGGSAHASRGTKPAAKQQRR